MKRETRDKDFRIKRLYEAARYIVAGADTLAELDAGAERAIARETGMVRDYVAERRALREKAADLLEAARRIARTDPDLAVAWEPENPRGPLGR